MIAPDPSPRERAEAAALEEWRELSDAQRLVLRQGRFGETLRRIHKETARVLLGRGLIWQPGLLKHRGEFCVTGWGALVAFEPERAAYRGPGPGRVETANRTLRSEPVIPDHAEVSGVQGN